MIFTHTRVKYMPVKMLATKSQPNYGAAERNNLRPVMRLVTKGRAGAYRRRYAPAILYKLGGDPHEENIGEFEYQRRKKTQITKGKMRYRDKD